MAKDVYRYFRIEARELLDGLSQGVLALERGEAGDHVVKLLRLAHTLKGAARVVKQPEIAQASHQLEDVLAPHREATGKLSRPVIDALLALLDAIGKHLATLSPVVAKAAPEEALQTVRVDVAEMDSLLRGVFEVGVGLSTLHDDIDALDRARRLAASLASKRQDPLVDELRLVLERTHRNLRVGLDQTEAETAQLREQASQLRLLPVSTLFGALERAARDTAQTMDLGIEFETSGGDHRLDASVLTTLRDALLHVVRNAVAHGLEPARERAAAGKPANGKISIAVERRGHRVALICNDDGRGIDAKAVRASAVALKLITPEQATALSTDDALKLVLRAGVTTREEVSQVAGRGVGLDVLRVCAAKLKGEISIRSQPGRGTSVEICVPVSLSAISVLSVKAGTARALIPLESVRQTVRVAAADLAQTADAEAVLIDGHAIPFVPLARLLRCESRSSLLKTWSVVLVESGGQTVALGVDSLTGIVNVVVSPLPRAMDVMPTIAGASLDAEGNPQLVLDPVGLVAEASTSKAVVRAVAVVRPPVLVIDDSMTTRMLEQSILESAGYEVEVATSAEEGLVKARQRSFGLFVVDVEMPGMSGFEFVELTRTDPQLKAVPAILVTSRSAPEDLRRGEQAGASAYIVKGEFDQGRLLSTIQGLIG